MRLAHCRQNPIQLLTDWLPEREPAALVRHEVRRQPDLVGAIGRGVGVERIAIPLPSRRTSARAACSPARASASMAVGGAAPADFGLLAPLRARARRGGRPRASGSEVRRADGRSLRDPVVEEVRAGADFVPLTGELGVAELAALPAMAPVFVASNSDRATSRQPWAVPSSIRTR